MSALSGEAQLGLADGDDVADLQRHPAVHDDAVRGQLLHAFAVGVDERDVVAVERLEVLVVEARPLAELAIPGLERLGGRHVAHDLVDA